MGQAAVSFNPPPVQQCLLAVNSPELFHPLSGGTHKRDAYFYRSCISQLVTPKPGSPPEQVPCSRRADIYPKATKLVAKSPPDIVFEG